MVNDEEVQDVILLAWKGTYLLLISISLNDNIWLYVFADRVVASHSRDAQQTRPKPA